MIIHYNCTRLFLVALVVADLQIMGATCLSEELGHLKKKKKNLESVSCV